MTNELNPLERRIITDLPRQLDRAVRPFDAVEIAGAAASRSRPSVLRITAVTAVVAIAAVTALVAVEGLSGVFRQPGGPAGPSPTPQESLRVFTKGPIPPSARLADGSIDVSQVPDFIPATNGDGTAGWIASRDVFPAEGEHMPEVIMVFADDLQTVVGHMYPGVGFVPLGREEEMLPPPGQDRDLTITIRNDWDRSAILEVIEPPDEVEGRPPARIAPSIVIEAGDEREVQIRAPSNRWSLRLANGDRGFLYSEDLGRSTRELESGTLSAVYVAIDSNGSLSLATEP